MVGERNTAKKEKTKKGLKLFKMRWVYEALGITKQGYYQRIKSDKEKEDRDKKILSMVNEQRKKTGSRTGTEKLLVYLKEELNQLGLKVGRDKMNEILRNHGMLVRRLKSFHITTDSKHYFYKSPNLLKDMIITNSEQVFVCDITYIKLDGKHAYLALVTDAYSRKIMGFAIEDNMRVELVKEAIKMAKSNCIFNTEFIVHHSDRGIQYCCPDYSQYTEGLGFILSTTQQYDPYENAVAERVNGILKQELGLGKTITNLSIAKAMVKEAISIYNEERIHWSLDLKTPEQVHKEYNKQPLKTYKKEMKDKKK